MNTRMRSITILLFLTAFLFVSSPRIAHAANCTWTGGNGNWNDPAHWIGCGGVVPGPGDDATIATLVTVTVTEDANIGSLTQSNGTLTGPGNLTAGTINWSNGTMSGSGTTTATNFANFTGSNLIYLNARTFNNAGAATWNRTGYWNISNSAIINNQVGATFTIQSSGSSIVCCAGTFNNLGTLTKTSAGDTAFSIGFNNSAPGTVSVESGLLEITNTAASSSSGAFYVASGATLSLIGSSPHNLSGNITGTGTIAIAATVNVTGTSYAFSGTTTITAPGGLLNLNSGATATIAILNMSGGTLTGAGDLTAGTINWDNGTMSGSGTTTATNFANFTGSNLIYLNARTFNNAGAATWNRTGYWNISNSAIINNQAGATFNVQSSGLDTVCCAGTFNNLGTLNLTTGKITVTTFKQEAGGITNLTIGGTTPLSDYCQIHTSDIYLTGPLNINFTGGYTPQIPDNFILLRYDSSRTGDFSPVNVTHVPGIRWSLYYLDKYLHLVAGAGTQVFIPIVLR